MNKEKQGQRSPQQQSKPESDKTQCFKELQLKKEIWFWNGKTPRPTAFSTSHTDEFTKSQEFSLVFLNLVRNTLSRSPYMSKESSFKWETETQFYYILLQSSFLCGVSYLVNSYSFGMPSNTTCCNIQIISWVGLPIYKGKNMVLLMFPMNQGWDPGSCWVLPDSCLPLKFPTRGDCQFQWFEKHRYPSLLSFIPLPTGVGNHTHVFLEKISTNNSDMCTLLKTF